MFFRPSSYREQTLIKKAGDHMNDLIFKNKDFVYSVLESSYDGIYITDKNSITVYVNKAYENLTGHKRSEYIGKSMDDLIKSGIMKAHITQDVIAAKKSVTIEEELISGKNVLVTGSPIFDHNNEIIAVVTNVRDISEIISLKRKNVCPEKSFPAIRNSSLIRIP